MRYKLRSGNKLTRLSEPRGSSAVELSACIDTDIGSDGGSTPMKRKRPHRRKTYSKSPEHAQSSSSHSVTIFALPQEVLLILVEFLDHESSLSLLRTCKWFHSIFHRSESFWRLLCVKTEFTSLTCLEHNPQSRLGWAGTNMYLDRSEDDCANGPWHRTWRRGIKMRRNVVSSNFQGWRLYSNSSCPVTELSPNLDMNSVKQSLGEFPKLLHNDDIRMDWDDKHLVLFHFYRADTENCIVRVWDVEDEPKFLYQVQKGTDCVTDKVSVFSGYVVIVPSWPLDAEAIVMTLNINNNMEKSGKYLLEDEASQHALDEHWEHTQLRVVRSKALVVFRAPDWRVVITSLPECLPLTQIFLTQVSNPFDCQQIRSYKGTAVILFAKTKANKQCSIVTIDVNDKESKVRSTYPTDNVTDVALYTEPEEIYLMKGNGNVVLYDATTKEETVKIANRLQVDDTDEACEYQLFVNGKEQICVVQSAPEPAIGRSINVYSYDGEWMYEINLEMFQYGLSRDESVCIYTNAAFLAAADSKRFILFNVRNGNFLGIIHIPTHLERSKGKNEKDCMFEQTGLGLCIFDENRLIAVHDYERCFPAVLDIYKFW